MAIRWYKRGLQFIFLGGIVTGLVLWSSMAFWSSYSPRGSTKKQFNATDFFSRINQMQIEPTETLRICQNNPVDVLVVVPSSVRNQQARKAIRESLRLYLPSSWPIIFYLGLIQDPYYQNTIAKEGSLYGDLAQDSSFHDSYNNLTLKTLSLVSWAHKFCKDAKYVLKIDDDVFLNIKRFKKFLSCITAARNDIYKKLYKYHVKAYVPTLKTNTEPSEEALDCEAFDPFEYINYYVNSKDHKYESYLFGGYLYKGIKADRNPRSKWYLEPDVYRPDILPPFLSGTAYVMSSNLLPHILYEAKQHPIITLEDVYLSGIVGSQGLKLKLSHLEGWSRFRPRWDSICTYNHLMTAHGLNPTELSVMTLAIGSTKQSDCSGLFVYLMDAFNSVFTYLFPRVPG